MKDVEVGYGIQLAREDLNGELFLKKETKTLLLLWPSTVSRAKHKFTQFLLRARRPDFVAKEDPCTLEV